jgi:type I restriction enzyme S subunit
VSVARTVRLKDVADVNPKMTEVPSLDSPVSFVPMSAVDADTGSTEPEERLFGEIGKGFTRFRDGDVLVAKITPCFENGKIAQARLEHPLGFGSTEFHVVRAHPEQVNPRYLVHFLRQESVRRNGEARMTGSAGQRRVPKVFISELEVPLPPLSEQRRIADILDRTDTLRAKRRVALAELDILTESIFLEMFGNSETNSKGFPLGTLGDVATFVGGGTPSRAVPEYFTGSLCWATSKDMKARFLDDTQEHVTPVAVQSSATKLVPPGTILVVVKSKVLMHRLPVAVSRVETCFGQDLKGIVVDDSCTSSYVATALRVNQDWLLSRARGINTEGLTLDHLRRFPLLLPSKSKQRDFAHRADQQELVHQRMSASLNQLAPMVHEFA